MRITENIREVIGSELRDNRFGRDRRIDSVHRIPVRDNIFNTLELTHIKNTLYETKTEEFIAAQIFTQTNEYLPGAREVGYDMMEPVGTARVGASGGAAKDIPFVTEKMQEVTQKAVEIEVGIKYTRNELEVAEMKSQKGRGPVINLVTQRAATARKTIGRLFDQLVFQGNTTYNLKGLQSIMPATRQASVPTDNKTVIYQKVAATGTSSSTLWSAKTGQNIIKDLNAAKYAGVERGNIFNGKTLIVDPAAYALLANPYSDLNGQTILSLLKDNGTFTNIYRTSALSMANNGRLNTYFLVCDDDVDIAEIPILRPITVFPSVEEWTGEINQLVALRFAGLMVKYLGAFYFGDGHIEAPHASYDP
jgi:hypothetical protein